MLLRKSEDRTLAIVGAALVLCIALTWFTIVLNPFAGRPRDRISVTIDTPYVGQGVNIGTALVMHGVQVGHVTDMASLPGGGIRLTSDLEKAPVAGLTDKMTIDFRPINYFGVTGINIISGAGGQPLSDGMQIGTVPRGNFALQALLSRLGEISAGAITPQLISTIDRATRYTDGLNPLIETVAMALQAVADVQSVSTARLLANSTGVAVVLPPFADMAGNLIDNMLGRAPYTDPTNQRMDVGVGELSEDFFQQRALGGEKILADELFAGVGRLETKYVDDLLPAIDELKTLTDPVPVLLRPDDFGRSIVEMRTRLENMFVGSPEQRALQVRIILDSLPGLAAPLGEVGAS